MPGIDLRLDGDGAFAEFAKNEIIDCGEFPIVACLEPGMASGAPSIALALRLPDGRVAFGQTSALAFLTALIAIAAKFPTVAQQAGVRGPCGD